MHIHIFVCVRVRVRVYRTALWNGLSSSTLGSRDRNLGHQTYAVRDLPTAVSLALLFLYLMAGLSLVKHNVLALYTILGGHLSLFSLSVSLIFTFTRTFFIELKNFPLIPASKAFSSRQRQILSAFFM